MDPASKRNPSTFILAKREFGLPIPGSKPVVSLFIGIGGVRGEEPFSPEFSHGEFILRAKVPVPLIHVRHAAVDDEQLILRDLVVKDLGRAIFCSAWDIDSYIFAQGLSVHRL